MINAYAYSNHYYAAEAGEIVDIMLDSTQTWEIGDEVTLHLQNSHGLPTRKNIQVLICGRSKAHWVKNWQNVVAVHRDHHYRPPIYQKPNW